MTIRSPMSLCLLLSLAGACSSKGIFQDAPGGTGGGSVAGQSGGGTGGGQSGGGNGGTGGAAVAPTLELSGLAYGNGAFVAVGVELQNPLLWTGVIYASTDGAAWTRVGGSSAQLQDVKFGNGKFVAIASQVSDSGVYPAQALVSDDGQAWTMARDLPDRMVADRIAFGAGSFVTAGMQAHLRSTDGVTWTAFGPAPETYFSTEVDFGAGRFVSWTPGASAVAVYDGNAWSTGALPDTQYRLADVRVVNDRFVAVTRYDCCFGEQPDAIRWGTASSADGSTWAATQTSLFARPPQVVHDSGTLCIAIRDFDVLGGDSCSSLALAVTFHDGTFRPEAALNAGGVFVVSGMGGLLTSTDGRVWTKRL